MTYRRSNVSIVITTNLWRRIAPSHHGVSDYIAQGKLILQGSFVAKIRAHEREVFNLLKLNCKINDKLVSFLLDLGETNLFMTM
jgi:hypothetical protein